MSATENIFSGVIIVMIFLIIMVVLNRSTTEYIVTDYELEKQEHLNDLYASNFNTVLLVTEPVTKRPMSSLLGDAIYYREEILNFSNKSVNVSEEFIDILDEVYGKDRYYFEVKPKIIDVSLNFVIDGSPSLSREREKLALELSGIVSKVNAKINETGDEIVTADVFILEDKEQGETLCDDFPDNSYRHISQKGCQIIDNTNIYNQMLDGSDNVSFELNGTDYLKSLYNLSAPYDNETLINGKRVDGGIKDYYGSDWGVGSAYVSLLRKNSAKLVIIFPVGDELSTSSIPESCFNIWDSDPYRRRAMEKMCDLCTISCSDTSVTNTEERSLKTVKKAIEVANINNHIINPIFAYNCDYDYKTVFNLQYQFIYGSSTTNACGESSCGGCSVQGSNVCFHPECKSEILAQMEMLAVNTQGKVIDLHDIENLDYDIDNTIQQNIDEYKFSVGTYRNITRHAVKRIIPLPNKMMVDAKLYIYPVNETDLLRG